MERGSELIHLQTSWAMGTLDNVLNICKELNFPLIWYDAKHEVPAALQIGAFYLSALLLKGEGKKFYDTILRSDLMWLENYKPFNYAIQFINNDIAPLFLTLKEDFKINITEPNNFSTIQSKPNSDELYPEMLNGINYLQRLLSMHDAEYVRQYLNTEAFSSRNPISAVALAELALANEVYKIAVLGYIQCTKLNPNKAIYWGQAGIAAMNDHAVITALYLLNQAIKLDPYNPHWYLYKVLSYTKLLFLFKKISQHDPDIMKLYGRITAVEREINFKLAEKYITYETPESITSAIRQIRNYNDKILNDLGIDLNPFNNLFS